MITRASLNIISGYSVFSQLLIQKQSLSRPEKKRRGRSSQVAISREGGCTGCSCSTGLCLVSLMLRKADHTISSTAPADQGHNPFTTHLPYCLPATCIFLARIANRSLHMRLRLCCVILDAFSREMKWMNDYVCSSANRKLQFCKHLSGRVFHRLLGNHDGIV